MPTFALRRINWPETKMSIYRLTGDGQYYVGDFVDYIKENKANYVPEIGDLFAILQYVAQCKTPLPPQAKYRKIKSEKINGFEAKSNKKNLRLFVFFDEDFGMILAHAGEKVNQEKDIKIFIKRVQDYLEYKKNNHINIIEDATN